MRYRGVPAHDGGTRVRRWRCDPQRTAGLAARIRRQGLSGRRTATILSGGGASVIGMGTDRSRPGLRKRFGGFEAVRGVDVDVAPGEVFGFLGPDGAGKSSTMRMIARRLDALLLR